MQEINRLSSADVTQVAIGVVVRQSGGGAEVLIARRRPQAVLGGLWEFPGGKVEPGESPQHAAQREVFEELGLVVDVGEALPPVTFRYDHATVRLQAIYCTLNQLDRAEAENLGVAEHRWVRVASLSDFEFPAANSSLVQRIANDLG